MAYEYKMIQIPPTIEIKQKNQKGNEAAHYLESIANEMATKGWEFQRIDTVGVSVAPGCIAGLFGARHADQSFYVITFRKLK